MNLDFVIAQLQTQGNAIIQLVGGLTPAQARWRPRASDWSVLEVLNHLIDEEREDFPARLRVVLAATDARWAPIAPQAGRPSAMNSISRRPTRTRARSCNPTSAS